MSVEDELEFVDSNVIVYAHDASSAAKSERAATLLHDLWTSGRGCLSIQVLQEFFVTVTRKVPRPLDATRAAQIVADLARWRVHSPRPEDVLEAIEIHRRSRLAFWDALIVRSALQLGCSVVWSEDLHAGRVHPGVTVRNPFA
jgi:predicted nucleic acid-binding protein